MRKIRFLKLVNESIKYTSFCINAFKSKDQYNEMENQKYDGVLKVGHIEIILDQKGESILINDLSEENPLPSLRLNTSRAPRLFSASACFPPEVFKDEVVYQIAGFDPHTGDRCTNEVYLGRSGHFYQWGNNISKVEKDSK